MGETTKQGRVGKIQPFDSSAVERRADGLLHYQGLHQSVVAMLRATVDEVPDEEALVEVGGGRLTYQRMWDRATRVAG